MPESGAVFKDSRIHQEVFFHQALSLQGTKEKPLETVSILCQGKKGQFKNIPVCCNKQPNFWPFAFFTYVSTGLWRKLLPIPALYAQPKHNHNQEKGGGKPLCVHGAVSWHAR